MAAKAQRRAQHIVFDTMGTTVHATLCDILPVQAMAYQQSLEKVFARWNSIFSRFRDDSELMKVNRTAGHWREVSALFFDVIMYCLRMARQTEGVFDPSVGAYLAAAGYGLPKNYTLPHPVPTFRDLAIDTQKRRICLAPGQILEPAPVVKGMAMDAAATVLAAVPSWMLNVGGDTVTHGSYDGNAWIVGIQDPQETQAIVAAVAIRDQALATSGDYAVRWHSDGRTWHHQITLPQGRPTDELRSVSVVAPTATLADEYTSIAFLLGLRRGVQYLEAKNVPYLLIDRKRRMHRNALFDAQTVPLNQVFDF